MGDDAIYAFIVKFSFRFAKLFVFFSSLRMCAARELTITEIHGNFPRPPVIYHTVIFAMSFMRKNLRALGSFTFTLAFSLSLSRFFTLNTLTLSLSPPLAATVTNDDVC